MIHLSRLESQLAERLLEERKKDGIFHDLENFIQRVSPGIEQLIILIRSGALRFTGLSKQELLWNAHLLQKSVKKQEINKHILFNISGRKYTLPQLNSEPLEDVYDEIELLGFPVSMSYFDLLTTPFRGEVFAGSLSDNIGKTVRMAGLLVVTKYIRTIKGDLMCFATFLDSKGEMFDTTHFPDTLHSYPFRGNGIYLLLGKVVDEFGYASVETKKMAKLPLRPDPRES